MEYRRLFDAASSYVSQLTRAVSNDFSTFTDAVDAATVVSDMTTAVGTFSDAKLIEGFTEFATVVWLLTNTGNSFQ
jgi:hypothetical protein